MISGYSPTHSTHSPKQSTSSQPYDDSDATQRFVIGKIDAGIAVLISDSVHLIEFPSLLLPPGVGPGSIVNIACARNVSAEKAAAREFWDLQRDIFDSFGAEEPTAPNLQVRNTTQTSVTLEWDKLELASASLISLSMYRNGQRLTTIPNPLSNTSTKLSGLQLDTDYSFHLVLKTTAGTFSSPVVKTRTHTIDNTTGIHVCFGLVHPPELFEEAKKAVKAMGASYADKIEIHTTHYIGTSSASRQNPQGGPGVEYQKALQLSIPVVSPEWLLACQRSSKLVPISAYYLGQTNHAASLSSAELVTPSGSIPQPRAERKASAPAATAPPPPPVVLEEPEAPPVILEEDVEEPPRDDVVEPEPVKEEEEKEETEEESPVSTSNADETDSSTRAFKAASEEEEEADKGETSEVPEVKVDAPGEELAAEQEEGGEAQVAAGEEAQQEEEAATADAAAEDEEKEEEAEKAPQAELLDFVDGEDSTPKASATFDEPTPSSSLAEELVDVEASADDSHAAEAEEKAVEHADLVEEEKKDGEAEEDEGETSLVDISL